MRANATRTSIIARLALRLALVAAITAPAAAFSATPLAPPAPAAAVVAAASDDGPRNEEPICPGDCRVLGWWG